MKELIKKHFYSNHDEDGVGQYQLKGRLNKREWFMVKDCFDFIKDDYFVSGWSTTQPEKVIEILVRAKIWKREES